MMLINNKNTATHLPDQQIEQFSFCCLQRLRSIHGWKQNISRSYQLCRPAWRMRYSDCLQQITIIMFYYLCIYYYLFY